MKNLKTGILAVLLFFLLPGCMKPDKPEITIAAASSTRFLMKELTDAFTEGSGIHCQLIIASSGKLTAQIMEGAPYNLFLSANLKYPEELYEAGLTTDPPEIYAYGSLVLWTSYDTLSLSLEQLDSPWINHIALANPVNAPYGIASIEVLKYYRILSAIEDKLVYGESISQSTQFIISQTAEVGFTSKSVVLSHEIKDKGNWIELSLQSYSPIAQGVVIIKKSSEAADKFYQFLFSLKAKTILEKYGYKQNIEK
jgi:molybdate transport system substrate-binding protein